YEKPEKNVYSAKNEYHKVFYHRLNTSQAEDELIYEDKEHPLRIFSAIVSDDGNYLVILGSEGTSGNNIILKDLNTGKMETVVDNFDNDHFYAGSHYGYLYFI